MQVTMLSMLKPASAMMPASSFTTPILSTTSRVMRVLPSASPITSTKVLNTSVSVMMPTTAPMLLTTGRPLSFSLYITRAASSMVAVSGRETTSFAMISATVILSRRLMISNLDRVVAGDGATRMMSRSLMMPTRLPFSTTGRRRIFLLFISLAASLTGVVGSTVIGFLVMRLATNIYNHPFCKKILFYIYCICYM